MTIILVTFFAYSISFAQSDSVLTSKKGFPILPKSGEVAVGMSMSPILTYFGNFFHGNNASFAPTANFLTNSISPNAIFLKYFLEDNAAVRVSFEASITDVSFSNYVQDDAAVIADPLSNAQVTDILSNFSQRYLLGVGYEMRRGSTRLQGVLGANAVFMYGNFTQDYKYGNPMSAANPLPSTHNFGGNIYNGGRIVENFTGINFGGGANVFLGVEYFVLPKISLGAEVSYGLMLSRV